MSVFSSYKKIFLFGFIIAILIAIPFSVYIAQKRQQITSKAAASTTLSLNPASPSTTVDQTLSLDIVLDPGSGTTANQVSYVKLVINFDSSKFTTVTDSLVPNPSSPNTLTTTLEDPVYTAGTASISLSIGADPTKILTTKAKIATLKLKALAPTDANNPSSVVFDKATQVLSIAASDQTSENVLSTTTPAKVTISGIALSPTPTSPVVTTAPGSGNGGGGSGGGIGIGSGSAIFIPPTTVPLPTRIALPPTGPGGNIVGIGAIGAIFTIIGGALFLLL